MPKRKWPNGGITKGFPKELDDAPNAYNDNEMSKEVLMPRVPEGTHPAGQPRNREPAGKGT